MHRLLIKYREKTCNKQELDQVLAYLKTEAGQQHLAQLIDEDIDTPSYLNESESSSADYDSILDRIGNRIALEKRGSITKRVFLSRKRFSAAVAVVALLLLAATTWFFVQNTGRTTYQTAYGETQTVTLPDGSMVTLNAHSCLTLSDEFDAQREVWLKGEAFFEVEESVRQQDSMKFVVYAGRLQIEVLGTSFNVQDWEEKTQVVLTSGKVKLTSATHKAITMEPGELAEVTENSRTIQKKAVNPDLYSAWTENQLRCNDTPLGEIATVIEHRYGKKVVFQQPALREITVTGTMPLHSLSLLTEVLKESLPITIQVDEETLIIRKKSPAAP